MSAMELNESIERYRESMKKASSRCRELGIAQKNLDWNKIAFYIDSLLTDGMTIYNSKAIGRQAALAIVDQRVGEKKDG